MTSLDWSKTDVASHPDSPWLTTPPTEQVLREYRPHVVFTPSDEVRDPEVFAADVRKRMLFGHPKDVKPIRPEVDEYLYTPHELSPAPPPTAPVLIPPPLHPDDPQPTNNFLFPKAGIFTLKKTSAYQRGYVYTTPYFLDGKKADHHRMLRVEPPPQLFPQAVEGKYVHKLVPECVQMVPGVPFAFEIDGKPDELHTIGAVHTFESLRHERDFWSILEDTILVAKGLRGCRPAGNTDDVFPIASFPIKTNDRSPTSVPEGSKAGSYNLANTLLKGNGPGIVLPAAQVDTPEFRAQVTPILQSLSRLRRRLLRKTLSKFEYEATEFNSEDMNVVGFGGLEPGNATACQLNLGSLWQLLSKALGLQGSPHTDENDEETRKTYFLGLFSLPPGSDPGAFLLARTGLFIRELNTWAIHIIFDGTDIHTGIGATTTMPLPEFKKWVESELEPAWKLSELGRIGVVTYAMRSAHNRDTYMSMTPSARFGNFAPDQPTKVRDFATHGQEILGGQEPWANRMGREIVYSFWNQLQLCNLDLGTDIDKILQSISFKNQAGDDVPLKPLPFHPVHDAEMVSRKRGHFEYLRQRCSQVRIYIAKHQFLAFRERLRSQSYDPAKDLDALFVEWHPRSSLPAKSRSNGTGLECTDLRGSVVKILECFRTDGQVCYRVLTDEEEPAPRLIQQNDPRLPANLVKEFLAAEVRKISSVTILDRTNCARLEVEPDANSGERQREPASAAALVSAENPQDSASNIPDPAAGASLGQLGSSSSAEASTPAHLPPAHSTRSKAAHKAGEPDPNDDEQYDVERIVDVAQTREGKKYLCKLTGYPAKYWIHENDLSTECADLLRKFYRSMADDRSEDSESSSELSSDSDASQEKPNRRAKRKRRKLDTESEAPAAAKAGLAVSRHIPGVPIMGHTSNLEVLLNVERLRLEIAQVQENRPTKGPSTRLFFQALGPQAPLLNFLDMCYIQDRTLSTMEMVIDSSNSSTLEVARAEFAKLTSSLRAIPHLTALERVTTLLTRVLRWTNARAHIVIYRWCSLIGPATIKALFELHRDKGRDGFIANPAIGKLVNHIHQYICAAQEKIRQKERDRKAAQRAKGKGKQQPDNSSNAVSQNVQPDLSRVPGDLFGMLTTPDKKQLTPIVLPKPCGGSVNVYAACESCLLEVFQKALIIPSLRQCNDIYAESNRRTKAVDDDSAFSRAICRGAILDCIVEVCEDDGILSSNGIDDVTHSPWLSFAVPRADRLGPSLLNNASITLTPLQRWLSTHLKNNPDIVSVAKELGDEIHAVLQEMTAREAHPESVHNATVSIPPSQAPSKPSKPRPRNKTYTRPNLDAILPDETVPRFSLPALIIREALNLHRGRPAGDTRLRRLLQGAHATMSSATFSMAERNPDHFDPRREFNQYTALFQRHFASSRLTEPVGLSNALAWFGTGQGLGTRGFLDGLLPRGFFQRDVAAMIQQFENIISQNSMSRHPQPYDNPNAWGNQYNQNLLARPTKHTTQQPRRQRVIPLQASKKRKRTAKAGEPEKPKEIFTLEEKFGPMFEETVRSRWIEHLGPVANQDPEQFDPKDLPTWSSTLQLVTELEIPAFKTGLTAMQLVNTLAFSKVVQIATVEEMAEWISRNPKLGAVSGLKLLGFRTDTSALIRASYSCFHNSLEAYLTQEDQDDLGFHTGCSEHILCKTPRWNNQLELDKSETLEQIAARLDDSVVLPLPLHPTRAALNAALKKGEHTEESPMDVDSAESPSTAWQDLLTMEEDDEGPPEFIQGSSGTGRLIVDNFTHSSRQ
ncbi:hypothetical protein C8R47DRAFT_1159051 [Mycena vitilis]|nr:hypothetical protein C8R47DRAFT_1159051 [Mycena vitilis]